MTGPVQAAKTAAQTIRPDDSVAAEPDVTPPPLDVDGLDADAKRKALADLLRKRKAAPKDWPLSLGQERLYRLACLHPDIPLYNVAVAYRMQGGVEAAALGLAVQQIEQRHDILRTTFPEVDGQPVQRVAPGTDKTATFRMVDLRQMSPTEQSAQAEAVVAAEVKQTMDLALGPLWRLTLIQLGDQDHILVLTMHHLVSDGWSFEVFLAELTAFYDAHISQRPPALERPALQYAQFGSRQREEVARPEFADQRRYWETQLAAPLEALRLPAERAAHGSFDRAAKGLSFSVPADLGQALRDRSSAGNATLFMALLAGFAALLSRATGQADLLVCTPVAGRQKAQSRGLIGYFNNILPMRLDLSGDPSLDEVFRRARTMALDAYRTQDFPFQWAADLPGMHRIPLSRLLFSVDMEWPPKFALPGAVCTPIATDTGAADFDLSVSIWLSEGQIRGQIRFKPGHFDDTAIAALGDAYLQVLHTLVENPGSRVSALPGALAERSRVEPAVFAATGGARSVDLPRTALEQQLVRAWEAVFETEGIGIHDNLQALGASSLAVTSLADRIGQVFQARIPITDIFRAGTVAGMASLLQSSGAPAARSPLAPIQPNGNRPPLFLCEGVGIYFPLVPYLGPDQPLYGLITEVDSAYPKIEDLAAQYVSAMTELYPEGPYNLGGISFGGLVAFEMAQQLHAMGREVGVLALFDTPGPGAYRLKAPWPRLLGHARNLWRGGLPYLRSKLEPKLRRLVTVLPPDQSTSTIHASRPEPGNAHLRRLFKNSADFYTFRPYDGRITLFTLAERAAMRDTLFDPALGHVDPLLGWGPLALQGVDRVEVDGEHITILQEPFIKPLAERLGQLLGPDGARLPVPG